VQSDDHAYFVARFANGALGSLAASWVTPGRKMQLDFELVGTKGSLVFTQERFNELQLCTTGQAKGRGGFKTLLAGPDTPPYGNFCPAPGHQLGFNDLKTIEVAHLVRAVAGEERASPGFVEAYEIQRVIAAALSSGREKRWVAIGETS
jgi:predicted dehydrogenase